MTLLKLFSGLAFAIGVLLLLAGVAAVAGLAGDGEEREDRE